ncbi:hypothetical protein BURPS1710b_3214 [Burkholderia pseudomallei 1710b]|uniref:Uncharacterized protein n=1 Tax=Burkholderia pseudomallei (strain 1710b) TaxID=320372 RepID=Q3JPB8_BURP1|nr:hypothetical protein BURPS1710b_3214 [Burkholderia pseudomallei 1710b]
MRRKRRDAATASPRVSEVLRPPCPPHLPRMRRCAPSVPPPRNRPASRPGPRRAHRPHRAQDRLARRGCGERRIDRVIAHRRDRVADREEHRERQQQRRLADRLRPVNAVLRVAVVEQSHAEIRRTIVDGRDLVRRRRVRHQPAAVVPPQLLGREPPHSLDERALDLPDVERRIQRRTDVVQRIRSQHTHLARQRVDDDLGDRRAVRVIEERPPAQRRLIPVQLRRRVKAVRPQLHARAIRVRDEFLERHGHLAHAHLVVREAHVGRARRAAADMLGRERGEPLAQLPRGVLRGLAVQVGTRRRGRRRCVSDLARVGRRHANAREVHAELVRDDLRDLRVEPLAHLRAAVVHEDRAVGIDVNERARLVEMRDVERNAELHRRERDALLQHRARRVERARRRAARAIRARRLELGDQLGQHVVLDRLAVRRHVALGLAVQVRAAHVERIAAERARDAVDDVLDRERALGAAEAAKRGVRLRVRLPAAADDRYVGQPVRVVEVAHGARHHGPRQIGGEAAARRHVDRDALDHARVVVAHVVAVMEIVPLAGDHHVVVAIGAQLHRALQLPCGERGAAREQARLRFLAAEAAPHAPAFDEHVVRREPQRVRDEMLHLARVLRRAVDVHRAVFLRHRVGDLPFEIELLLAAQRELARIAMRGVRDPRGRVAAREPHRRQYVRIGRARRLRGQDRRPFFVFDLRETRGAARGVVRRRDDDEHRLPDVLNDAVGKHRIVVDDRPAIVRARNVGRGQHRDDARRRAHRVEPHRRDPRVRLRGQAERRVQRARDERDVVDVGGAPAHVQMRGFMRPRDVDLPERVALGIGGDAQERFGLLIHCDGSAWLRSVRRRPARRPLRARSRPTRAADRAGGSPARSGTAGSSRSRAGTRSSRACR